MAAESRLRAPTPGEERFRTEWCGFFLITSVALAAFIVTYDFD